MRGKTNEGAPVFLNQSYHTNFAHETELATAQYKTPENRGRPSSDEIMKEYSQAVTEGGKKLVGS